MTRGVATSNATMVTSLQLHITQEHTDIRTVRSRTNQMFDMLTAAVHSRAAL